MLKDSFDRAVTYLRLSVTDRCNFRCLYCMPPEGLSWFPPDTLLQDDEIIDLVQRVYVPLGIRRIRLTGGEPLLRKNLPHLAARLSLIAGIEDLSLSTNGQLLCHLAAPLRQAGVRRVNISLDSLKPDRFREMTRGGQLDKVLAGIQAALTAGMLVKLNTVVVPGVNDDEIVDLARLTQDRPLHLRFIEMMPVGHQATYDQHRFLTMEEMLRALSAQVALESADGAIPGNGPAKLFRLPQSKGTIGLITPMSRSFCQDCNRTRLTADGQIKACLMRPQELDLLGALRRGASTEELQNLVAVSLDYKPRHHDGGQGFSLVRRMSQVGG